jgi:molybdopterin/thiamine biosynthesis adenylyltransferase
MLTERELDRYDRQIRLLGRDGQEKLKRATIFIAGAGGLGSPISIYLAAAGIGKIILVDNDTVSLSNLNRQILHWEKDLGQKKVVSAYEKLNGINQDIDIEVSSESIDQDNVSDLVGGSSLIIDAMDNYPARYLLNRAAISKKIPFIHGAVSGFCGQATTVIPGESACLRCIFRDAPMPSVFPVIGVTPGIIGMIQAAEAIKYIVGVGELLAGKLLIWDGLTSQIDILAVERNQDCKDCGGNAEGITKEPCR